MNFFVFLLSICIVISYANAQYQPYYYGGLYPNYPINDGRSPKPENTGDNRLFWSLLTSTTTTSTTTTTTTTCTISTALACTGRRKRFLEDDEEIAPSPVNKVETTNGVEVTEMDSARNERKAEPQFAFWRGGFDQPSYELRSTFGEVGQRTPFPSYNPYYMRRPIIVADPRFLLYYPFTTTTTSTSTVTATSTSIPVCSQASGFNVC